MATVTQSSIAAPTGNLIDPDGQFSRNYNRQSFMFAHGLAANPLFDLENLIELARRMPDHRDTYWSNGSVAVGSGWLAGIEGRASLQDTIANIAENKSIIILKHTEQDPEFGPVLQDFLAKVVELVGERMRADVTVGETLILISSPCRVTPYHMDAETNFLVQVRGDKWFYVFDQNDRTLVSDEEYEHFYCGDISAIKYRSDRQRDARAYDLRAGFGVHVPSGAPHWVQNKDGVSVAISVNYELQSIQRAARVHRVNRRLRRLGLTPSPPGDSQWRDHLKLAAMAGFASMRSLRRKRPEASDYAVWTPPPHV